MASSAEQENQDENSSNGRSNPKPSQAYKDHEGQDVNQPPKKQKPSPWKTAKALWAKTGIDRRTYTTMFKGALAPTIALALYQADSFADYYTTLGYLVIIMAILPVVITPRAKFLQTMLINILFVCVGCAFNLLALFCAVKARVNSVGDQGPGRGGPGTSGIAATGAATSTYNSSASAVSGVWLFTLIYMIGVIRGRNPQYTVPCILCAVLTNVSMTYAPQFSTMAQGEQFVKQLLVAFLTGFGIATGVSLFIFPMTSRQVVFKGMTGYISGLRGALQSNLDYLHSLEETDMFAAQRTNTGGDKPARSKEAEALKQKVRDVATIHAKLSADLPFAKREVAMGKIGPDDIQQCFRLMRLIMIPIVNLAAISDIFNRIAEQSGWDRSVSFAHAGVDEAPNETEKIRIEAVNEWHELMRLLRSPFDRITQVIDEGLQHIAITLDLMPRPKPTATDEDIESTGSEPRPGEKGFSAYFEKNWRVFIESKKTMLRGWCHLHGIDLPDDFFENPDHCDFESPAWMKEGLLSEPHRRLRKQLLLCLYIEFLLINIARRTYNLMVMVEGFERSGKMSKSRLIVPGFKRLRKWVTSLISGKGDINGEDDITADGHITQVYLGDAYKHRKDPEHLPPTNAWEHFGDQIRKVAHFFRSPASVFGVRCACATMCIAIVNYLQYSQTFFTTNRLFWAQIMVTISMTPTAGQSLRGFFYRIVSTACAMLLSWIAWYIVDQQTAGVIVIFFVFIHAGPYIIIKYPQNTSVSLVSQVTMSLIIGYELQVRKIGVANATSNGQRYYPIYELGPIRLATVAAGVFVAFFWTLTEPLIFPYPISEHNQVRENLASALYLLANYYSVTHETVRLQLLNQLGDMTSKDSPGRKLEKARIKLYTKANLTIQGLRAQSNFLKFDIPIGGRFPREQYQNLIDRMQSMLSYMSVVSLASYSFDELRKEGDRDHGLRWLASFETMVSQKNITSEQVTTLLSLISASVSNGQPLPPYLRIPEPWLLAKNLEQLDEDILSVRHIAEPGYASFAVVQIGTRFIHDDLRHLVEGVKELVGVLDFSYHIVSTADTSREDVDETLVYTRTNPASDGRVKQE